jgi:hypothetical protein
MEHTRKISSLNLAPGDDISSEQGRSTIVYIDAD